MHLNKTKKFHNFIFKLIPFLTVILVVCIFFFPVFQGKIPFPGDLLVGEYVPYSSNTFMGYAPGGYPNKAQGFDILRFIYPAKEFSIESLKHMVIPLWNPYNLSGNPHLGSLQSGTFYIFNFLFFLFEFTNAWTIYIVLQPILAGLFMYVLLREFRLEKFSSLIGSISFAFSSYMTVWIEYGNLGHTIIWLPLIMWLTIKNLQKTTVLKSVLIVLSLSSSVLAGYIQTAFYLYLYSFVFVIFMILHLKLNKKQNFFIFFLIYTFSILLTLFQLLPTLELIMLSVRPSYPYGDFVKLLIPKLHAITILFPDFFGNPASRNYYLEGTYIERVSYIGVIPLLFVFFGLNKISQRKHLFFLISTIVISLFAFDTLVSRVIYYPQLPFISTAVPTRIMFLFSFSLSIIAAYGYDKFIKFKQKLIDLKPLFILSLVVVFVWIFAITNQVYPFNRIISENHAVTLRNMLLPSAIYVSGIVILLLTVKLTAFKKYSHYFFLLLTVFELFYFFHKITPFSIKETIYPPTDISEYVRKNQGLYRTWGYGKARIDTNLQIHEKIYSTDGYEPLHNKRYSELLAASVNGYIPQKLKGSIAELVTAGSNETLRDNIYRQKLLDLLGVRFVLNLNDTLGNEYIHDTRVFPEESYRLIWQNKPWQVYENLQSLPRYYLTDSYLLETDKNLILEMLFKLSKKDKTIILEEKLPQNTPIKEAHKGKVTLVEYTPNMSKFKISTEKNNLFFLSDNYFPGWKATIDEQNVKIYRANYTFRAVVVPAGQHIVTFSYEPESFYWGLKISLVSFLIGILLLFYLRKKKYV